MNSPTTAALLALTLFAVAGCQPGSFYYCDCYCVRQVPLDEQQLEKSACVADHGPNSDPEEEVARVSSCPTGYNMSGCVNCKAATNPDGSLKTCYAPATGQFNAELTPEADSNVQFARH